MSQRLFAVYDFIARYSFRLSLLTFWILVELWTRNGGVFLPMRVVAFTRFMTCDVLLATCLKDSAAAATAAVNHWRIPSQRIVVMHQHTHSHATHTFSLILPICQDGFPVTHTRTRVSTVSNAHNILPRQ